LFACASAQQRRQKALANAQRTRELAERAQAKLDGRASRKRD